LDSSTLINLKAAQDGHMIRGKLRLGRSFQLAMASIRRCPAGWGSPALWSRSFSFADFTYLAGDATLGCGRSHLLADHQLLVVVAAARFCRW